MKTEHGNWRWWGHILCASFSKVKIKQIMLLPVRNIWCHFHFLTYGFGCLNETKCNKTLTARGKFMHGFRKFFTGVLYWFESIAKTNGLSFLVSALCSSHCIEPHARSVLNYAVVPHSCHNFWLVALSDRRCGQVRRQWWQNRTTI